VFGDLPITAAGGSIDQTDALITKQFRYAARILAVVYGCRFEGVWHHRLSGAGCPHLGKRLTRHIDIGVQLRVALGR
jgi:hypothetical protein